MARERQEVPQQDCWNVEALFPSLSEWENELKKVCDESQRPHWPQIAAYKGSLGKGASTLKDALNLILETDKQLTTLYTYAHLRNDENITNDANKSAFARITNLMHDFGQELSWFEPELLSLSESQINSYLNDPLLADYRIHLEKIVRMKPHTLSADKEELIALCSPALQAPHKTFSALNDADFAFGSVLDKNGKERELTHGLYGLYIRDQDRILRKNAFTKYHSHYKNFENSLCELITGVVQRHRFNARARKYSSCLEAALFPNNIDTNVYRALIKAVNENIGSLHRYVSLRKKVLQLDSIHLYDLYVPLVAQLDKKIPYSEAENLVIQSVAPLGPEYQEALKQGLKYDRWVDRYENKNKRSGAYSSGCYTSMPYILMNYKEQLRDVFTLAHEAGHSMHSLLSRRHQPYQYSDYSIFVAEVASTFNEELLMRLLLKQATSKEEKIYLINQKIEDIRSTLHRQTMFAEFELMIHELIEKGTPLTPKLLKEAYRELNARYFGSEIVIDVEAEMEWARIPHFYYNFYVYQYSTGISAALSLANRVLNGGDKERDAYLSFLKGGSSKYPIDMLQSAGVDMRTTQPVNEAIEQFTTLVNELEGLMQ